MAWPKRFCPPVGVVCAGALSLGLASGCCLWDGEVVNGDSRRPPVMMPEPNGAFVHKMEEVQTGKAQASNFVFFLDEWYKGGTVLGPYGTYHLSHIVPKLPEVPFPVVIQPSPDPGQNEVRRQQIVAALVKYGVPEADQRVIIAYPDAEGLYGEEAPRVYLDMLRPRNGLYGGYGNGVYGGYGGYSALNNLGRPGYLLGGYGGVGVNPFGY